MKKLKFSKLQNKIAEENNKRIQEIVAELVSGNNKKIFEDGLNGFYVDENPEGCWAEEIQKYIGRMSSEKQPVACLLGKKALEIYYKFQPILGPMYFSIPALREIMMNMLSQNFSDIFEKYSNETIAMYLAGDIESFMKYSEMIGNAEDFEIGEKAWEIYMSAEFSRYEDPEAQIFNSSYDE